MTDRPLRRYGQWAGNRQGQLEDITRCIASVSVPRGVPHQCERKRGYGTDGLYCAIHNPEKVAQREQKSLEAYERQSKKFALGFYGPALLAMLEKVLPEVKSTALVAEAWELIAKAKGEK